METWRLVEKLREFAKIISFTGSQTPAPDWRNFLTLYQQCIKLIDLIDPTKIFDYVHIVMKIRAAAVGL